MRSYRCQSRFSIERGKHRVRPLQQQSAHQSHDRLVEGPDRIAFPVLEANRCFTGFMLFDIFSLACSTHNFGLRLPETSLLSKGPFPAVQEMNLLPACRSWERVTASHFNAITSFSRSFATIDRLEYHLSLQEPHRLFSRPPRG